MRSFIRFRVFVLLFSKTCFSTKAFAQCASFVTMTADPVLTSGGYNAGDTVTFSVHVGSYSQMASNWMHGLVIDLGEGWDEQSLQPVQPSYSCSGSGYWAFYDSIYADGSGLTLGPGFFYDFDNQFIPADGNPGNNFGDENASGFCNWTFTWKAVASVNGAVPTGSVIVYGDGSSGMWNNPACGGDYNDINGLVENIGCNAAFSVTGAPYANWPLLFELNPFSVSWDSLRWWTADTSLYGYELTATFDNAGPNTVCFAVYDSACADTICADVLIQPNPLAFGASSKVFGFLFYDSNGDGVKQVDEPGVQIPLRLDSTELIAYPPSTTGLFALYNTQGFHTVLPLDTALFHFTTLDVNPVFFGAGEVFIGEIGVQADSVFTDASVLNGFADMNCDSASRVSFGVRNAGSTVLNGEVKFVFTHGNGNVLQLFSDDTLATVVNDTMIVPVNALAPFAYKQIPLSFNTPLADGDSVSWNITWSLTDGTTFLSGAETFVKTVECSNALVDKLVTPRNATSQNQTLRNTPLTYSIWFDHPAEDSVERVIVVDTLSGYLDVASLFVSQAGYPYEAMREGNALKIVLPDVWTYGLDRGFVTFNVNHIDGVPHNTAIHNTALVSIDNSSYAQSQDALVTIVDSFFVVSGGYPNGVEFLLSPNPASGRLDLTTNQRANGLVEILDVLGKIQISSTLNNVATRTSIDVSMLASGLYTCRLTIGEQTSHVKFVKN